jgi:2',3'-cyclic-nucleotide 2'-phosphodiesterase (5'-nucleotidase family)
VLFNTLSNKLEVVEARLLDNPARRADPSIARLVQSWHDRADPVLWQVIGYLGKKIDAGMSEMSNLLTIPWLEAYPSASIALFSPRYVQSLPAGDLSEASILSTLPMDNELVDVLLTGEQVLETIKSRHPSFGGLSEVNGTYLLSDSSPLEARASYHVLIPDSLYEGGNYYDVRQYDPNGIYTGLVWRTPIINWMKRLQTSRQSPLESYLGT